MLEGAQAAGSEPVGGTGGGTGEPRQRRQPASRESQRSKPSNPRRRTVCRGVGVVLLAVAGGLVVLLRRGPRDQRQPHRLVTVFDHAHDGAQTVAAAEARRERPAAEDDARPSSPISMPVVVAVGLSWSASSCSLSSWAEPGRQSFLLVCEGRARSWIGVLRLWAARRPDRGAVAPSRTAVRRGPAAGSAGLLTSASRGRSERVGMGTVWAGTTAARRPSLTVESELVGVSDLIQRGALRTFVPPRCGTCRVVVLGIAAFLAVVARWCTRRQRPPRVLLAALAGGWWSPK